MKKYWYTFLGVTVFLLLLFVLSYLDGIIMNWARHQYLVEKADLYISLVKLFVLPLAVVSLGINNVLNYSEFDWKLLLIFFVLGIFLLFKLIVYMPIPPIYKIFLVNHSDIGGIIIGLGIILSLEKNRS